MMRVFLLGFMAAGKSRLGKKLSPALGLSRFDLDDEIVAGEGLSISTIFEKYGESHFRRLEHQYLRKLSQNENMLLSCGGGTPCYSNNMTFMNEIGLTVWLNPPIEGMVDRLKRKKNKRPLLKGLDDDELTEFVAQKLEERRSFYEQSQLIVNPIKYNINTLAEKIKSCTNLI